MEEAVARQPQQSSIVLLVVTGGRQYNYYTFSTSF